VIAVFMLIPCAVPLIVTATDFVTLDETASKAADWAPAATVTLAGTFKAALLLLSIIWKAVFVVALRSAVQDFVWAPTRDCVPQEICARVAVELDPEIELLPLKVNPPQPAINAAMSERKIRVWLPRLNVSKEREVGKGIANSFDMRLSRLTVEDDSDRRLTTSSRSSCDRTWPWYIFESFVNQGRKPIRVAMYLPFSRAAAIRTASRARGITLNLRQCVSISFLRSQNRIPAAIRRSTIADGIQSLASDRSASFNSIALINENTCKASV